MSSNVANKQAINDECQRIYDRDGVVKASVLVDESRPEDAPLHDRFEWRDDKAGEQFRLIQARTMIRKVRVIKDDKPVPLVHVPVVVHAEDGIKVREGGYKPVSVVIHTPTEYEAALSDAAFDVSSAIRRIRQFVEAGPDDKDLVSVLRALEAASKRLSAIQTKA